MNALLIELANPASIDGLVSWMSELDPDSRFALLVVTIGCSTGIIITMITSICRLIQGLHRGRLEAEMKREMLDRGMSAEEIARVIESTPPQDFMERWAARKKS